MRLRNINLKGVPFDGRSSGMRAMLVFLVFHCSAHVGNGVDSSSESSNYVFHVSQSSTANLAPGIY